MATQDSWIKIFGWFILLATCYFKTARHDNGSKKPGKKIGSLKRLLLPVLSLGNSFISSIDVKEKVNKFLE